MIPPDCVGTGVFATDEDMRELREINSTPPILTDGNFRRNQFPESPTEACHRLALAHGLPEIGGHYGMDQTTRQFIHWDEAKAKALDPEKWVR